LGAGCTLGGRVANALPVLTRATEQATAVQRISDAVLCRLPLGETQVVAGRLEERYTLGEHTLALARKHGERGNETYALRLLS
jgi:hypothetical protein